MPNPQTLRDAVLAWASLTEEQKSEAIAQHLNDYQRVEAVVFSAPSLATRLDGAPGIATAAAGAAAAVGKHAETAMHALGGAAAFGAGAVAAAARAAPIAEAAAIPLEAMEAMHLEHDRMECNEKLAALRTHLTHFMIRACEGAGDEKIRAGRLFIATAYAVDQLNSRRGRDVAGLVPVVGGLGSSVYKAYRSLKKRFGGSIHANRRTVTNLLWSEAMASYTRHDDLLTRAREVCEILMGKTRFGTHAGPRRRDGWQLLYEDLNAWA